MKTQEAKCEIDSEGTKRWHLNGEIHREDGPACEFASGFKSWFLHGKLHREDGHAVEYASGYRKDWYINGIRHREDGPAIVCSDGVELWFINGKQLTEKEINKKEKEFNIKRSTHYEQTNLFSDGSVC